MSRIAIIPARGGSKRIPHKNIIDFYGKPMIEYALDAAATSGLFDKIHVSTENSEIAGIVEKLGFTVDFLRPMELADDYTPIMPVLKHVIETYSAQGASYDTVCLIMAANPLLEVADLEGAVALYERHGCKSPVMAVVPYPVPVEWAYSLNADGYLEPREPGKFAIRSQDLEQRYYDAGSFVVYPSAHVMEAEGAGDDSRYLGYRLPRIKGVDIDEPEDLAQVHAIYRALQNLK